MADPREFDPSNLGELPDSLPPEELRELQLQLKRMIAGPMPPLEVACEEADARLKTEIDQLLQGFDTRLAVVNQRLDRVLGRRAA